MKEALEKIQEILEKSILNNDKASIIVSGGSSPTNLVHALNNLDIEWKKVKVMLLDERLVKENDEHSNEQYLKRNFFKNYSKNAKYQKIRNLIIDDKIDLAILGFGTDGHFASIFPCHLEDDNFFDITKEPMILQTDKVGNPCVARLTMNLSAFSKVENIFIIINSEEKLEVINNAKHDKSLPIHYLLNLEYPNIKTVKDF
jgi:6-phosphogluconolactonase